MVELATLINTWEENKEEFLKYDYSIDYIVKSQNKEILNKIKEAVCDNFLYPNGIIISCSRNCSYENIKELGNILRIQTRSNRVNYHFWKNFFNSFFHETEYTFHFYQTEEVKEDYGEIAITNNLDYLGCYLIDGGDPEYYIAFDEIDDEECLRVESDNLRKNLAEELKKDYNTPLDLLIEEYHKEEGSAHIIPWAVVK